MLLDELLKTKPLFVNEKGVEWWLDADLDHYAKTIGLKGVHSFVMRETDGTLSRGVIESNELVYSSPSLEAVACFLDILRAKKGIRPSGLSSP